MRIAYDAQLRRPGCALLAAAMGASTWIPDLFPSEWWLLSPTPDLRVYEITREQLVELLITKPETS